MPINLPELQSMIDQKYISVQKHPQAELYIYNYAPKTQYERLWTELTLLCRGLILDATSKIIARPFPKFFNLEEHQPEEIPNESFEVYEKLDGSLGILYWHNDEPFIATRGSFDSDQARKATQFLYSTYAHSIPFLQKDQTYLFEIIYPENRIVVDYGQKNELILLAILDNKTGQDLPLEDIGFPLVKKYDGLHDIRQLRKLAADNREGFVVRFKNGFRVKVKFEEYVRLHRILTGVSNQMIWEMLREDKPLDEMLDHVPDEFYQWVKHTREKLLAEFANIETQCKQDFRMLEDRKTTALYFLTCRYPGILFAMLDNRDYKPAIWKMIKPKHEKPFKTEV
ncbi:2'-5' RNA ligase [Rhodocytophaga rosea]|uniref:2'-5' RNA ligase n=1 Tax=Rhodocytophaga rosea TaxID=2704465 RepID=A0A6C0GBW6_9BACT|nr:T4 RnlA family RNA ligase [Rhodocytophaga rosea]QHT65431.1 2'-5' RNA ligase [Rhodocytophaga rosea]